MKVKSWNILRIPHPQDMFILVWVSHSVVLLCFGKVFLLNRTLD